MRPRRKDCSHCGLPKQKTEFYSCKTTVDKLRPECKSCQKTLRTTNLRAKKVREPEYKKARTLYYKYGISLDDYKKMLVQQDNKCKICRSSNPRNPEGFSVDHNHSTGEVRGLLCHGCNTGLGFFRENVESLERAIQYLRVNK